MSLVLAMMLLAGLAPAGAATPPPSGPAEAPTDSAGADVVVVTATSDGPQVDTVRAASPQDARVLADRLDARPDVISAEPSRTWTAYADPYRDLQWGMDRLRAEQTWQVADAFGTTIAVLDTGVDASHEDLAGRVLPGRDFLGGTDDATRDPCETLTRCMGHGTGVAGIAGAVVGNGIGIAGFGRATRILPVRVLDESGNGRTEHVVSGIYYAVDQGVDVINMSLGGPQDDRTISRAIEYATDRGVMVVAAVGNTARSEPNYPAAYPRVLGVSATKNRDDDRTSFSSFGNWVDVAAPGERIFTTRPLEAAPSSPPYTYQTGTSFSAPFVAATVAILKNRYPRATPSQIFWRITSTATDIGSPGEDRYFGHGLVNPFRALTLHPDAGCRPDPGDAVRRVWARARVETAAAVACELWPEGQTPNVILATANDFPDALAGAALAARYNAPLLLTSPNRLSAPAAEMIHQLGTARVFMLGGTTALSAQVATDLGALGVDRVDRVAGANRYETAALTARTAKPDGAEEVVIASGTGFADAVSAGALVASPQRLPVLLSERDRLPAPTVDALRRLDTSSVLVLGGPSAVSDRVVSQLESLGLRVRRIAGADRYETSVAAAEEAVRRLSGPSELILASGAAFPDALAGGAAAARISAPLLLVPPAELSGRPAIADFLGSNDFVRGLVVGGSTAVGEDVRAEVGAYMSG